MANLKWKDLWNVFSLPLATLLVLSAIFYWSIIPGRYQQALIGRRAPNIRFSFTDGKASSIWELQGKVLLLNFWASWCSPCVEEMPSLKNLEEALREEKFLLLAFHVEGDTDGFRSIRKRVINPRHLITKFEADDLRPYAIAGIPYTILVDKEGMVRQIYFGPRNWKEKSLVIEMMHFLRN